MSPDGELQLREVRLQEQLQRAANGCTTLECARRFIAFAVRSVKHTPLPDGATFARRIAEHLSLLEVVQMAERWLDGRPPAGRHELLHVDAVKPDSAVRSAVHHLYLATRCAETAGTNPDKLGEAAGHACTAAFKVRRPPRKNWPTPEALDYQERLFAEVFAAAEETACPAVS
jgi:hypothetical protein